MNDDEPTPPMGNDRPPMPRATPKPDPWNDPFSPLAPEMRSSVMHPRTGTTRRFVIWGTVITVAGTLLQSVCTPISEAVADRIRGPQPVVVVERDGGR